MTTETLVPIASPHTDEWHALRKTGIGASEAAAACGFSNYSQPLKIYQEKTGQLKPFAGNLKTRSGNALEPVVREEFESSTGIKVIQSPMGLYRSAANPFVLATPDADLETRALGEWKTTGARIASQFGAEDTEDIPVEWLFQCQQQMYVLQRERVYVAVLIDNNELKVFKVERNDRLIEGIIVAERELWDRCMNHDPPEPDWEHPRTPPLIREMYGLVEAGDPIELSPEAHTLWAGRKLILKDVKEMQKQADECKAKVLHEIGNSSGGILPGTGKMVRRKEITRKAYSVEEKYVIDVREVKTPKHLI